MNEFDLSVSTHMRAPVETIRDTEQLAVAARVMDELGISALPVLDGGCRLTGILERSDLVRVGRYRGHDAAGAPRLALPEGIVAECMQSAVPVIAPTGSLRECAGRMVARGLHRVYVVVDRDLVGIVGTREMMHAVARAGLETPLRDLAVDVADSVAVSSSVSEVTARSMERPDAPIVVLDGNSPVGVFSRATFGAVLQADPGDPIRLWMDASILVLPADTPAHLAAERALESRARCVIARDEDSSFRVITALSFVGRILGQRPAPEARPLTIGTWEPTSTAPSTASRLVPPRGGLEEAPRPVPSPPPGVSPKVEEHGRAPSAEEGPSHRSPASDAR